jgi:hypothetical protein
VQIFFAPSFTQIQSGLKEAKKTSQTVEQALSEFASQGDLKV